MVKYMPQQDNNRKLTFVLYSCVNKKVNTIIVRHGDINNILGRDIVYIDGQLCDSNVNCKFCNELINRLKSRHQSWWK